MIGKIVKWAKNLWQKCVIAPIEWVKALPGRVWDWIKELCAKIWAWILE